MAATLAEYGLDHLSVDDRLALVEALWESISETDLVSDSQKAELERRHADSLKHPDAVTPWEVIRARALARARS
ncbi:MAG: addiction module protein [Fimbriiglobus sp.]